MLKAQVLWGETDYMYYNVPCLLLSILCAILFQNTTTTATTKTTTATTLTTRIHMGPNNLNAMSQVTSYVFPMSLSTVFIKGHVRFSGCVATTTTATTTALYYPEMSPERSYGVDTVQYMETRFTYIRNARILQTSFYFTIMYVVYGDDAWVYTLQ